jgi:hypothetical protein
MKSKKESQCKFPKTHIQLYKEHKKMLFKEFLISTVLLRIQLFLSPDCSHNSNRDKPTNLTLLTMTKPPIP